jgi:hypothetical protein
MSKAVFPERRSDRESVMETLNLIADRCRSAVPDVAVDYEIQELEAIKRAVERRWPLAPAVKKQMTIGAFAAKNLQDFDPTLADLLMKLDFALQHDVVPEMQPRLVKPLLAAAPEIEAPKQKSA